MSSSAKVCILGLLLGISSTTLSARPLREIQARGHLIVGLYVSDSPLTSLNKEEVTGLEPELGRKLAQQLFGTPQVQFKLLTAQERLEAIELGTVDMVIGNLSLTAQRTRVIDFSSDYYRPYQALLLQTSDPAQKLADLDQAKIAVLAHSSSINGLARLLPQATVMPVSDYAAARQLLAQGQVRAVSADNTVLAGWVKQDTNLRLLSTPLQGYLLAIGLPKGLASDDLRQWVNQTLGQLQQTNWLQATAIKWGL